MHGDARLDRQKCPVGLVELGDTRNLSKERTEFCNKSGVTELQYWNHAMLCVGTRVQVQEL